MIHGPKTATIHILNPRRRPSSDMTSEMWCGATAIELFDGAWVADEGFVRERDKAMATCGTCLLEEVWAPKMTSPIERAGGERRIKIRTIRSAGEWLEVLINDGRTLHVRRDHFKLLRDATETQLANYTLIAGGEGARWPELDEDISVRGFLRFAETVAADG
jgi:Protein of unknown function (DUF2442)